MSGSRKARVFWPLLIAVLAADCSTKSIVVTHLDPHLPFPILGSFFRLTLAFNRGSAMGLWRGESARLVLGGLATLVVLFLFRWYRATTPRSVLKPLALALVIGGALGNLGDRLRWTRGVVDFIDIGIGSMRFWTFNVADIGVTVGAVLLAWALHRESYPLVQERHSS